MTLPRGPAEVRPGGPTREVAARWEVPLIDLWRRAGKVRGGRGRWGDLVAVSVQKATPGRWLLGVAVIEIVVDRPVKPVARDEVDEPVVRQAVYGTTEHSQRTTTSHTQNLPSGAPLLRQADAARSRIARSARRRCWASQREGQPRQKYRHRRSLHASPMPMPESQATHQRHGHHECRPQSEDKSKAGPHLWICPVPSRRGA